MKTLLGILLLGLFAACEKPACPGFERVETGSRCRSVATGEFVAREHCEEC